MRSFVASLLLTLVTGALPAAAQGNPLIVRGQEEYGELRFEEALQTLSAALVRQGNSRDEQATVYRLLAFTYLALGREEEASGAYRSMLPLSPEFEPGQDVSPRIREFFSGVRSQWEADGRPGTGPPLPVDIRHRSPPEAAPGEAVPLSADVEDPAHRMDQLVLAYRQGTSAVFTRLDTTREEGSYVATIPGEAVAPPLVEYYFEALDAAGLPIAARGDVAAPLRIAVPEPGGGFNVAEEWWFWTIIGVVVAGGVVATAVAVDQASQPPPVVPPTLGTFIITVQ